MAADGGDMHHRIVTGRVAGAATYHWSTSGRTHSASLARAAPRATAVAGGMAIAAALASQRTRSPTAIPPATCSRPVTVPATGRGRSRGPEDQLSLSSRARSAGAAASGRELIASRRTSGRSGDVAPASYTQGSSVRRCRSSAERLLVVMPNGPRCKRPGAAQRGRRSRRSAT